VLYNGDLDIGAKLAEQWKGSFRNPYVGRELGLIFTECGVVDLRISCNSAVLFQNKEFVFRVPEIDANEFGDCFDFLGASSVASSSPQLSPTLHWA
jgi:hypothetical protein